MATVPLSMLMYHAIFATLIANENYTIFTDDNGTPFLIDLNEHVSKSEFNQDDIDSIRFLLYTQDNPKDEQELILDNLESIEESDWDANRPTKFITHGWRGDGYTASCTDVRNAYLKEGNYNVIVVDWNRVAANVNYIAVTRALPNVAKHLARFIDFMQLNANLNPSVTKIVGHSLGAHVAGLAARFASSRIGGVVGLDPARPKYENVGPGERVDATDADHVQIIHTNADKLGLLKPVGTSDFYPNGGRKQPGCMFDFFGACSHARSYLYFAESIINRTGFRAESYNTLDARGLYSESAYMGGPSLDPNANGAYVLQTAGKSPFALG